MSDQQLIEHLRIFYNLIQTNGSFFDIFGAKVDQRIDIIKVDVFLATKPL